MTISRSDRKAILIIGAAVGLLVQPILANNLPASVHEGALLRIAIFLVFLLGAPLALWIASLIARRIPAVYQFAQFAAVGTLNTFIDLGVLNLETFFYGGAIVSNSLFAGFKAFSFLCATTNSFVWNKYWTFSAKEKASAKEVAGFYTVAVVGWVLNVGVATLVKASGAPDSKVWTNLVAPLAGVAASFMWDFLGYKYLVFKKKGSTTAV